MRIPKTISWTVPRPTKTQALELLDQEAAEQAAADCSAIAQSLDGQKSKSKFLHGKGQPTCEQRPDGYACFSTGTAECRFIVANMKRVCPAH